MLTFSDHVEMTLKNCVSGLYTPKVLKVHGLPVSSLHDVFNATVLYCSPPWSGYSSAADCNHLDAFLRKAHKLGFCADISETVMDRFDAADDAFFERITACAVATSCCISDMPRQWESRNFDPHSSHIFQPILMKLETKKDICDTTSCAKFG